MFDVKMSQKGPLIGTQDLPMIKPEEVGMSSKRLSRIRPIMQRYVDRNLVPGVVTLVARQGHVVYLDAVARAHGSIYQVKKPRGWHPVSPLGH